MNIKSVSYAYNLQDIVAAISETLDLIDPALSGHHRRTAYIASRIARECGLKESDVADIMIAGGMHDIGALSLREKFNAANFESTTHEAELQTHAEAGYHLLKEFAPFLRVAEIIRYHHILWRYGDNVCPPSVGSLSFILNLADRIDVTLSKQKPILAQVETVHDIILKNSGMLFVPEYVEAFIQLSKKESFWFDLIHFTTDELFKNRLTMHSVELPRDEVLGLAKVVAHIIDYRSRFTATHSSGVAKVARILAEEFSFSQDDAIQMEIAGYFHDIGKLAVPDVILEKNAPLSLEESHIMRIHPYYGREILKKVKGFEKIAEWGPLHHERLDGSGYPYHLDEKTLSLGSRIMAVTDIFTALAEDRPYRQAMDKGDIISTLLSLSKDNKIDSKVVSVVAQNFSEIDEVRRNAQSLALKDYELVRSEQ